MATAYCDSEKILLEAAVYERDVVTQLPGAVWDRVGRVWKAPLTWSTCLILRGLFGASLQVHPTLVEWSRREYETRIRPALEIRDAMTLPGDHPIAGLLDKVEAGSDLRLKAYQRADVAFMVICGQALLANDPGLGKTPVTIRAMQVLRELGEKPLPAVIICPNSVKYSVWANELVKWAPELAVQVIDGSAAQRRKQFKVPADIYIINWEAVRLHSRLAPYGAGKLTDSQKEPKELNTLAPRTVVWDEAHRLVGVGTTKKGDVRVPRSLQGQASWAVGHQARFRFALTGTPVSDHVGDLWAIEHAILPDWFASKTRYLSRFAEITLSFWGGTEILGIKPSTEEEFHKITDCTFRRIPKRLALPELPPRLPDQIRHTYLTAKQRKLYGQMEQEMLALLDDEGGYVAASSQLAQLTRLLQFASASVTLDEEGKVKLSTPSAKVDDLIDLAAELGDECFVVAGVSRQLIELASAKLTACGISNGLITGRQSAWEREETVSAFQAGKLRAVLLTLAAGGEGISLTRSRVMCFMQRSWRHLENIQGEGRILRIGSEVHDSVMYVYQVTPNTVEQRVTEVLKGKEDRIEEVLRDKATLRRLLGQE